MFRLLGHLELDGTRLEELRGVKQRTLLAYLVVHAGEVVATERLVDAVWEERPPPTATAIVHSYVRRVRNALAGSSAELVTRPPGYMLELGDEEVDAAVFEQLAREGKSALDAHDPETAVRLLTEALSLWRGEALADLPSEGFVADERARLGQLRTQALLDRAEASLVLGAGETLIPELESNVREQPFHERPRRLLMLAFYRSGRQTEALALYRETRRLFAEELGLEPTRELRELEQAILRQDESLAPVLPKAAAPERRRPRWPLAAAAAAAGAAAAVAIPLSLGGGHSAPPPVRSARILAAFDLAQPSCCGFDFDGVAWGAGHHDDVLRKIDPGSNRIVGRWPVADYQSGVPLAAAGAVWIPAAGGDLIRFDPARQKVTARIPVSGTKLAFAYLTVWETTRTHQVVRIDLRKNKVVRSVRLAPGANNWDDELGVGEGAIWVGVADDAMLVRVDPLTNAVIARITGFGQTDSGMPLAVDQNAVWVLRFVAAQETLFRVDPATNQIVARIPVGAPNGVPPTGTVAVGGGYVWTGNWNRTISEVDPRRNRVVATYALPGAPQNVTYGDGSVWVDSYDASKVWRIDPDS